MGPEGGAPFGRRGSCPVCRKRVSSDRVNSLIRAFVDIALRRSGPEDLPTSGFLLLLTLGFYLAVSAISASPYARGAGDLLAQVVLDVTLLFAWFAGLLLLYRKPARIPQTMTALLGTLTLVHLVQLPLWLWVQSAGANAEAATLPLVGIWLILLWSFLVIGHIVHRALEIPLPGGILVAVAYFLVSLAIYAELFPATPEV